MIRYIINKNALSKDFTPFCHEKPDLNSWRSYISDDFGIISDLLNWIKYGVVTNQDVLLFSLTGINQITISAFQSLHIRWYVKCTYYILIYHNLCPFFAIFITKWSEIFIYLIIILGLLVPQNFWSEFLRILHFRWLWCQLITVNGNSSMSRLVTRLS